MAVEQGDDVLPVVHELLRGKWDRVVGSQDFHPPKHVSFASTHGKDLFTTTQVPLPYAKPGEPQMIDQVMWPDHCVQGTRGAEIEDSILHVLKTDWIEKGKGSIIQKGTDIAVDAYSAFAGSPPVEPEASPLAKELRSHNVDTLFVVGLATDYCVRASALDAHKAGFNVYIVSEGVRAVGKGSATEKVTAECSAADIHFVSINSDEVRACL